MTEKEIKAKLEEKIDELAKEIAKGKDIYITKSASEIKVKSMTVKNV